MQPGNESDAQSASRSFIEAARRAQIVRAAIETIAEVGYAKASFARIARRAGISAGLISYHFSGRDELIRQIVLDVNASMDRALTERAEGQRSYVGALRAVIEGFVHYCAEHRPEMLALGQIFSATGGDEDGKRLAGAEHEGSLKELEEMLREGQDAGEFRAFSSRLMAVTLLAAMEAVPAELYSKPGTDVDAYANELATAFELAVRRSRRGRKSHG